MIFGALIVSVVLAVSTLAGAYAGAGLWMPAALIVILGVPVIVAQRMGKGWVVSLTAVLLASAAAVGAWMELYRWLLLIGLIAALSAWDLDAFARRLSSVDAVEQEQALKRRHLQRLLVVDALGLLLGVSALTVQIRLSFGLALVLALIALVGLSRALGFLGRGSSS